MRPILFSVAQADNAPPIPPADPASPASPGVPAAPGTTLAPGAAGSTGSPSAQQQPGGGMGIFYILMFGCAVLWVVMMWNQSKDKKKRASLLESIKKGDKVLTIGGVIGTVSELRDDEVVLKIDESSNSRATFSRAAIQTVIKKA